jgi:transcription elongation factor GreA
VGLKPAGLIFMPTYLSKQGLEDLKIEYARRINEIRKEIAEKISAAKELGDLSENFEYHEAKEQQGLNEARALQLQDMIRDAVIVEESTGGSDIGLGTTFDVEVNNVVKTYSIVGSNESDPLSGKISNESPIGLAFMGHEVGDIIEIKTPSGVMTYKIKSIK